MPDPAVMKGVLRHLCRTEGRRAYGLLSDGELLKRFLQERDELAFEQVVERHGPMVRAVCRRMLGPSADADDAFQATFLVLIRKARSIRQSDLLANWLCAVAYRTARQALRRRIRIGIRERVVDQLPEPAWTDEPPRDWLPLFDAALQRLPSKYREPVVLCELQGIPRPAAASKLGLNEGTLSSRLGRARDLLRKRLGACGFPLAIGASLVPLTVPESLVASTVAAALNIGAASVTAVVLTEGVITAMFASKLKAGLACAAVLFMGAFAGVQLHGPSSQAGPPGTDSPMKKASSSLKPPMNYPSKPDAMPPVKLAPEFAQFQGEWVAESADNSGQHGIHENSLDEDWKFTADLLTTGGEIKEDSSEKFTLNAKAKPPTIDFTLTRFAPDGSGQLVPTPYQGIYKFEPGGRLIICFRQKISRGTILRPTRFLTAPNSGATLLVLRRPEKMEAKTAELPAPITSDPFVGRANNPPLPPIASPPAPPTPADLNSLPRITPPPISIPSAQPIIAPPLISVDPTARSISDLDRLQGQWEISKLDGKPATAGDRRAETLEFLKDRILASDGTHGRVTLDENKSPKQMTLTMAKPEQPPMRGIYKLEGDTLTFATYTKSARLIPTTFEADDSEGINVIVFERIKESSGPRSVPREVPDLRAPPRFEKAVTHSDRDLLKELDQLREQISRLEKALKEQRPPSNPVDRK